MTSAAGDGGVARSRRRRSWINRTEGPGRRGVRACRAPSSSTDRFRTLPGRVRWVPTRRIRYGKLLLTSTERFVSALSHEVGVASCPAGARVPCDIGAVLGGSGESELSIHVACLWPGPAGVGSVAMCDEEFGLGAPAPR